jgi:hypothetical protein
VTDHSISWNFFAHDRGASKTMDNLGSKLGGLSKSSILAGLGAVAGVAGVVDALKTAIDSAKEWEVLSAKTGAVIKSTGGVAHVSGTQVRDMAESLRNLSGVDETLIVNEQNVLLTMPKVRNEAGKGNDIFNQATVAALNMSTALGTDLQGATVKIGKSLQDPVKGMTALNRAGVQFTDAQKSQIKTLMASGHQMEAQKIILKELSVHFGGAAAAAGNTFAGAMSRLRLTFTDALRDLGLKFLPMLTTLVTWLASKAPIAIAWFSQAWTKLQPVMQAAGNIVKQYYTFLFTQLFPSIQHAVAKVMPIFKFGWDQISAAFKGTGTSTAGLGDALRKIWAFIDKYLIPVLTFIVAVTFAALGLAIRAIVWSVVNVFIPAIKAWWTAWMTIISVVGSVVSTIKGAFVGAKDWLFGPGKDMILGLWNGMTSAVSNAASWVADIGNRIVSAVKGFFGIHSPSTVFAGMGKNLMLGLLSGMRSITPMDIAKKVFGSMPAALGAMVQRGMVSMLNLPSRALDALVGVGGWFANLFKGSGGGGGNSANQALGKIMAGAYGWTGGQVRVEQQRTEPNLYGVRYRSVP